MLSNTLPEEIADVFGAFQEYSYDETLDQILSYKFGARTLLFSDSEVEDQDYLPPIIAYLYPRWRYIAQAMEYLKSEYNPIENYSGTEHEETEYDIKERKFTKGQQINKHTEPTDITKHEELQRNDTVTPATKTSTTTQDKTTVTNKVAPFDSSDFSNREQTITEGTGEGGASATETVTSQTNPDTYHYDAISHTDTKHFGADNGYIVQDEDGQRIDTDQAHKDKTTRDLDRHGNLGVMTAAQMMMYDSDFWKKFAWLDDIAHELAVILAESVWAM